MAYKVSISLIDTSQPVDADRVVVSSELPFGDDLEEAQHAYRRAVGSATGTNPLDQLASAARTLGQFGGCKATKWIEGKPITCVRPHGHEASKLKHLGPEPTPVEW